MLSFIDVFNSLPTLATPQVISHEINKYLSTDVEKVGDVLAWVARTLCYVFMSLSHADSRSDTLSLLVENSHDAAVRLCYLLHCPCLLPHWLRLWWCQLESLRILVQLRLQKLLVPGWQ
ncbi:hypothetical protein K503DRAFT_773772 [Rhizopogon vinicolor AM-OR11-026]|uniref:Uncharacterized protein n=1 Tax=Rhizopogon vinicolor AM-OR11-026 TaxID=1314800 RepID=A0A1B7MRB1_9AGAM|nr:hypothetical protein K503DRAFT_773772 [Rhizopogon vinicolor AM-OR11-026]